MDCFELFKSYNIQLATYANFAENFGAITMEGSFVLFTNRRFSFLDGGHLCPFEEEEENGGKGYLSLCDGTKLRCNVMRTHMGIHAGLHLIRGALWELGFYIYRGSSLAACAAKKGKRRREPRERASVRTSIVAPTMASEQLQVLNALDVAKTQWYHFTTIVIAGMGFFSDAYDLFCISLLTKLLGLIYYYEPGSNRPGSLPPNVSAAVNGVAFCGTMVGQLFFSGLGDKLGRKRVYGLTLMLMVLCSVASGLSFGRSRTAVMAKLCFFRFWLGFGIGGVYPLSATIMSEYANKKTRGAFIAVVFAMQGFGILASGMVAIVISAAFWARYDSPSFEADPIRSVPPQADYVWRLILMFGALPAALTYYWRMRMPETARFTALVARDAKRATADMSKVLNVEIQADRIVSDKSNRFGLLGSEFARRYGTRLLGTTTTWFLLDVAFYSQNLFQKDIFSAVGWIPAAKTMGAIEEVYRIARAQTLIALCSTVPGYWFTVAFIDRIGRFYIQLGGFAFMTAFMLELAVPYRRTVSGSWYCTRSCSSSPTSGRTRRRGAAGRGRRRDPAAGCRVLHPLAVPGRAPAASPPGSPSRSRPTATPARRTPRRCRSASRSPCARCG